MINLNNTNDPRMIDLNNRNDPRMIQVRADGGPVKKGRPYLVGERGPELVVPRKGRGRNAPGKKPGAKTGRKDGGRAAGLDCVPGSKEKKSTWFARLARGAGRREHGARK